MMNMRKAIILLMLAPPFFKSIYLKVMMMLMVIMVRSMTMGMFSVLGGMMFIILVMTMVTIDIMIVRMKMSRIWMV